MNYRAAKTSKRNITKYNFWAKIRKNSIKNFVQKVKNDHVSNRRNDFLIKIVYTLSKSFPTVIGSLSLGQF